MSAPPHLSVLLTHGPSGYRLLDSGAGRKLERFGAIIVDRPEPQALWQPGLDKAQWAKAHAAFAASAEDDEKGRWRIDKPVPEDWPVDVEGVKVHCRLAGLWHLGLFPEQLPHWQWMLSQLHRGGHAAAPPALPATSPASSRRLAFGSTGEATNAHDAGKPRVLNLFGYTGAASLLAAKAGAEVVHVDASKKAIQWGRQNQSASRLDGAPIRWICEDARKFAAREVRRGRTYHSILIDPPKFGRGPEGEVWDLFTHLPALLGDCVKLLAPTGAHMILTAYAIRASVLSLDGLMREQLASHGGTIESGELALAEDGGRRIVGTSMFSRWSAA